MADNAALFNSSFLWFSSSFNAGIAGFDSAPFEASADIITVRQWHSSFRSISPSAIAALRRFSGPSSQVNRFIQPEFDGEALKAAGVQALQEAFDDEFGARVQPRDLLNDFGTQIGFGFFYGAGLPFSARAKNAIA